MGQEIERPDGIECPKWRPKRPDSRRCYYYLDNGSCEHPSFFMCIEWMKATVGAISLLDLREKAAQKRSESIDALEQLAALARLRKASQAPTSPQLSSASAALAALQRLKP